MARKVKLTASELTEKWQTRTKQAIPDIQRGIERVDEAPGLKAAKKVDKMKANLMKSIDDGTWAKNVAKVDLATWKEKTSRKVGERLAGGVDGAGKKRGEFDSWLVGRLDEVLPKIDAMPDLTLEDSVNRVRTMMEHMSSKPYKKTR